VLCYGSTQCNECFQYIEKYAKRYDELYAYEY